MNQSNELVCLIVIFWSRKWTLLVLTWSYPNLIVDALVSLQKWWRTLILIHRISGPPSLYQDRWVWTGNLEYLVRIAKKEKKKQLVFLWLQEENWVIPAWSIRWQTSCLPTDWECHVPEQGEGATGKERLLLLFTGVPLPDGAPHHSHSWGKGRWRRAGGQRGTPPPCSQHPEHAVRPLHRHHDGRWVSVEKLLDLSLCETNKVHQSPAPNQKNTKGLDWITFFIF